MPPSTSFLLQLQLSTLQIVVSMYPEATLPPLTAAFLTASEGGQEPDGPDVLEVKLRLVVEEGREEVFEVLVSLPTTPLSGEEQEDEGRVEIHPRQPIWLPNQPYTNLISSLPPQDAQESSEYILSTIDFIQTSLHANLPSLSEPEPVKSKGKGRWEYPEGEVGRFQRVWFWFPTLSTKEKRDDIVNYANEWNLTGFVLAGKPALLCVEGPGYVVDKYMSRIKSQSWSDIPSFQKKVTERLRLPLSPSNRAFQTMSEITHLIPKYGQYNHRGEMGEVKRLMDEWGVGEDFAGVVLNSS